jgi:hypothetical protein
MLYAILESAMEKHTLPHEIHSKLLGSNAPILLAGAGGFVSG